LKEAAPASPHRLRGVLLATLTAVLWGTVPVAGKVALGGMGAGSISVLRLAVSGGLLAFLLARRGARPFAKPPRLVYLGALGLGLNYLAYMGGLEFAGAGASQVLIQTAPLFLILLGITFLGERPTRRELVGAGVAFAGVLLVSWQEIDLGPDAYLGVALILGAALAWAVYAVAHKTLGRTHAAGGTMMWIFLLAAVIVLPSAFAGPSRTPDAVQAWAIAYLCLNTFVAYWAFAEAIRHISATTAAVIATLGPAVTFGMLAVTNTLDQPYVPYEAITTVKILGSILVVGGVVAAVTARD
jgi:drug/metabolite transporter (DMT)-like permease